MSEGCTTTLPEPYATWFVEVVGAVAPPELLADCARCPMVADGRFHASARCCGYVPSLPNFRAGEALLAGGRAAELVQARLTSACVTSTFLMPTADEEAAYAAHRERFGRTDHVVCPFLDGGGCGIWPWRNATCATWFCRHTGAEAGEELWDAAADLFCFAEGGVAVWAAGGSYIEAAQRARELSWATIRELGGADLVAREERLQQAHDALRRPAQEA